MTTTLRAPADPVAAANPAHGRPTRRTLPPALAFGLVVSLGVVFLASASAPTPLYATYQAEWGFTPLTTTVVFGVYALAVLAALLVAGRLSDHVGRRPVLVAAALAQLAAMVVFTTAQGVDALLVARVVQGLATGAAAAAVGAALLDLSSTRGAFANAVATPVGTATGAIGSGLLVQFLPQPTHLVYDVLGVLLALQTVGLLLMAETLASTRPGAVASLRPRLGAPRAARRVLVGIVPALLAAWSLAGLYGALGPALVHELSGSTSTAAGGASLFALAGSAAVAVWLLRDLAPRTVLLVAMPALVVGVGLSLVAVATSSLPLFFAGTVVAGIGFGSSFQGSIRLVVPLAQAHERAGLLAVLYVVAYVGMGVPAIVAGVLVVHGGGLVDTAYQYGAAAIVLAVVAAGALALDGRAARRTARAEATAAQDGDPAGALRCPVPCGAEA
ncbi:MFS transporter [Luteimicrobium subarcticum]|uniref:Putative MFS family arabinose efflux permease n=1 Tax=Luteimicrobium subarcticum TaxID=620910 RepID=A0A2M8W1Q1_9MICO|nr:MFS transporter [Luteimicrobium subarcticum]PJI84839.1 putative MFS family arabinose efflux permease [Luteimicrobium subarcticum]